MNNYESVVILGQSVTDELKDSFIQKVKELVTANGEVIEVNEWGRKQLAYEIKKQTEGYYILFTFNAKPDFIAEFERILRLDELVIKHMVIKK